MYFAIITFFFVEITALALGAHHARMLKIGGVIILVGFGLLLILFFPGYIIYYIKCLEAGEVIHFFCDRRHALTIWILVLSHCTLISGFLVAFFEVLSERRNQRQKSRTINSGRLWPLASGVILTFLSAISWLFLLRSP
jgi:hypothetical protein